VVNAGPRRSNRTVAEIDAAPLGAFVAWRPLTTLIVPELDPGESVLLRTEGERTIPEPLGPPDRVPPARLLTALRFDDEERPGKTAETPVTRRLPPSPFDLFNGPSIYWAGNLNVFVGGKAVERHRASALRILPERTNVAMFVIGDRDSYRFDLRGLGEDWKAQICDPMKALSLSRGLIEGTAITPGAWTSMHGHAMLLLALRPPADCREAGVEVHVTKFSTRETAVVEFSFDPRASGPGCYVVD